MDGNEVTEDAVKLQVGAILGDSDRASMVWSEEIGDLSKRAQALSTGLASPIVLNVVYHVDGRIVPNEFEGVRTGRFSKNKTFLVVQAAIPKQPSDDHQQVLLELLEAAVAEADHYVVKKKVAAGLPELRRVVQQLRE